jgi:hypothetical protein
VHDHGLKDFVIHGSPPKWAIIRGRCSNQNISCPPDKVKPGAGDPACQARPHRVWWRFALAYTNWPFCPIDTRSGPTYNDHGGRKRCHSLLTPCLPTSNLGVVRGPQRTISPKQDRSKPTGPGAQRPGLAFRIPHSLQKTRTPLANPNASDDCTGTRLCSDQRIHLVQPRTWASHHPGTHGQGPESSLCHLVFRAANEPVTSTPGSVIAKGRYTLI